MPRQPRDYFSHDGPAGDTIATRARSAGYPSSRDVSEALAWCIDATPRILMRTLMSSPPHRRVLLDPLARDIGVGLVLGAPLENPPGPGATLALMLGG